MNERLTHGLLLTAIAVCGFALGLNAATWGSPKAAPASLEPTHEVLRAKLIELVSADGRVVAQLHTSDDGSANLRLRDGRGEVRVKLGATREGAGLILMSGETEPALRLDGSLHEGEIQVLMGGQLRRVVGAEPASTPSTQGVGDLPSS